MVAPGSPGLDAVVRLFGNTVLAANGALDRAKLRGIVFADTAARRRLEAALHPLIRGRTLERIAQVRAPYAIIVVPLLVETDFRTFVDRILVVDCPEPVQIERLMLRDGASEAEARAMLAAQADRATRLAAADDVVTNAASLAASEAQVDALCAKYEALARDCSEPPGRAE